jgi:hypothetical protein
VADQDLFEVIRRGAPQELLPRIRELETAKQELAQSRDDDERDANWDVVEQLWYELIDDYDEEDLQRWGISPDA